MAYDAVSSIIKAGQFSSQPSRKNIQQVLSHEAFSLDGATGTVKFKHGERVDYEPLLVRIVTAPATQEQINFVLISQPR